MSIFKNKKGELIKEGKALGINLHENMSVFEMESAIKNAKTPLPPEKQPSTRRGEY